MDKIIIHGLTLFAYHGVHAEEKRDGQHFVVDAILSCDLHEPCASDRLEQTVSYSAVMKLIRRVMTERSYDLIERAAEVTAQAILDAFPAIASVEITLKKPEAPIKADFEYVAVTICRSRHKESGGVPQ